MSRKALPPVSLTCRANAKINLTLEVLGRRPDGYHEIRSVMQALDLHDVLTFSPAEDLVLTCSQPELDGPDNLALVAAGLLRKETGAGLGAAIALLKRVPVAGGLGGGSSDAACALRCLSRLWRLRVPAKRLVELAASLGSDVPFFFYDGTALAEGRGEVITPLPPLQPHGVVLVCPSVVIANKTRELYSRISTRHFSRGVVTQDLAAELQRGGEIDPSRFVNVFLPILIELSPTVRLCWEVLREVSAAPVHLSGAGPTLYVLLRDESRAQELHRSLSSLREQQRLPAQVYLTRTARSSSRISNPRRFI